MKSIKDRFSHNALSYRKYRPEYPDNFIRYISDNCLRFERAWDCATGNGQVAKQLTGHFTFVFASDISGKQIELAPKNQGIHYSIQRAERTTYPDEYFDLITVGQAIHWFDLDLFYSEVKRVLRPGGILSYWGYGTMYSADANINASFQYLYRNVLGSFWDPERRYIDDHYRDIQVPDLEHLVSDNSWSINVNFEAESLAGYLNTWSAIKRMREVHPESRPVREFVDRLTSLQESPWAFTFPLFVKIYRKGQN